MSDSTPEPAQERQKILDQVGPRALTIFQVIREIVDDLENAAPWANLYSPPDSENGFFDMENSLLSVIEAIPNRVQKLFETLDANCGPNDMSSGELASFFDNTFLIISRDRDRLASILKKANGRPLNFGQRSLVCDLSADLKGKYESALMGVAGRVIAQGRWSGVEIEPVLFPEKQEEFERNNKLVEALRKTTKLISDLHHEMPLRDYISSWTLQQRIDQYALVDFTIVVGAIGQLLQQTTRRALYSGDFHSILKYERALSERVRKLQIMHASTWTESTPLSINALYSRLVELSLEITAILDTSLLQSLAGEARFNELKKREADLDDVEPLVVLLRNGDLRRFLDSLLGQVFKRESLSVTSRKRLPDENKIISAFDQARGVFERLQQTDHEPWLAFLAATLDPQTVGAQAVEFKSEIEQKLIPILLEVDSLQQFAKVLKSTCQNIRTATDTQPIKTTIRLLSRLRDTFDKQ